MYNHREAFCLMTYQSDDGKTTLRVWNSRDGVTPFIIRAPDSDLELRHVNMRADRCEPAFEPPVGSLMFIDYTEAALREAIQNRILQMEQDSLGRQSLEQLGGQAEAEAVFFQAEWRRGLPRLVAVTPERLAELHQARGQAPA